MTNKFHMAEFIPKDFDNELFDSYPNARLVEVKEDGISPEGYHALSVFPEYFKINGKWILALNSRMDTVAVAHDKEGEESLDIVEFRNLKKGDKVVVGRSEDGSEGIYIYTQGFSQIDDKEEAVFGFREGRSRETAFSKDYDELYEILRYEKENKGFVTWVLGTATSLDKASDKALENLVNKGYINAIFCGTAAIAYDLELALYGSIGGQEDYREDLNQRQNYYEIINGVNEAGSIKAFVEENDIKKGFVAAAIRENVKIVIAGTIRDRLTFPDTYNNVYEAQDAMRAIVKKSSTLIMSSAILFTIATGNMTPSYNMVNGKIRPIFIYTVDIQEFAVNKLADRGTLTAKSLVTNSQDFVQNIDKGLEK
ncbi:MAG: hypothetical protein Q4D88_01190 [Anaerococcus sp.]|nr:hypothetical protein [Anaerococcus sp.]